MCDGHAKWLRPIRVSSGFNAKTANDAQDTSSADAFGVSAEGTNGSQFVATMSGN